MITAWTTTSLPSSSSPAASQPRIIGSALGAQADAAQRPEVVVVQGGGLDGDGRPARGRVGIRAVADDQAAERIVGIDGGGVGGEHAGHRIDDRVILVT